MEKKKKNTEEEVKNKEKKKKKKKNKNLRIPKNQKFENFDFYELSADLSNSLTDKIYRQYLPIIDKEHKRRQEVHNDEDLKNDLDVDIVATKVREKVSGNLVDAISNQITQQVEKELSEQYHTNKDTIEYKADNAIKNIRWIMLPAFLMIFIVMFCIVAIVGAETYHLAGTTINVGKASILGVETIKEAYPTEDIKSLKDVINLSIANVLSILDLLLLGSLVIMVMIGGYENTVSRIGITHEVPTWFGKLNISQLKVKVAASIVIISSIHLLMAFMKLDLEMEKFDHRPIMWTAIVHSVFVLSALILAYMDNIKPIKKSKDKKNDSIQIINNK